MENASKALIIAGAILLAILLIGLGVFIFNNAKGAISDTGLDEQKISSINSKFEAYEGTITGAKAKDLVDLVRTNNNTYDTTETRNITLSVVAGSFNKTNITSDDDFSAAKVALKTGSQYTVTISYKTSGSTKGLVDKISIK